MWQFSVFIPPQHRSSPLAGVQVTRGGWTPQRSATGFTPYGGFHCFLKNNDRLPPSANKALGTQLLLQGCRRPWAAGCLPAAHSVRFKQIFTVRHGDRHKDVSSPEGHTVSEEADLEQTMWTQWQWVVINTPTDRHRGVREGCTGAVPGAMVFRGTGVTGAAPGTSRWLEGGRASGKSGRTLRWAAPQGPCAGDTGSSQSLPVQGWKGCRQSARRGGHSNKKTEVSQGPHPTHSPDRWAELTEHIYSCRFSRRVTGQVYGDRS